MNFLQRHKIKLGVSVIFTFGVWYTLHQGGLKIIPEGGDFQHVRWWVLPAYVLTLAFFTYFRSVRWRFLLASIAEVPKKRLLVVSSIGFAAILLLPFRIGEFVRPYMIRTPPNDRRTDGQRPITLTAATSSIVAERIIDGLYLSIVLAVALLVVPTVHPLPDTVIGLPLPVSKVRSVGRWGVPALFGTAFLTIAVFYFQRAWAHRTTLAIFGKVSRPLAERLAATAEKFADGLHVFGRGRDALGFFLETSLYWLCNAVGMWLLAWGAGVVHADGSPPTFGEACGLMGMLGVAILIPAPPGLLGVFQLGLYAGMTMYYPTAVVIGPGAAFIFLLYSSQVLFQLVAAACALLVEARGTGALKDLESAEDAMAAAP